jgi:hypothetical protein
MCETLEKAFREKLNNMPPEVTFVINLLTNPASDGA